MFNYIINLDRRTDRWSQFLEKIRVSSCLSKEKFIRFRAVDGTDYENEIKRYKLEDNPIVKFIKDNSILVNRCLVGCYLSHILVLHTISENDEISDEDYVGIYEDDATCIDDFDANYTKFKKDLSVFHGDFMYIGGRFSKSFGGAHYMRDSFYNILGTGMYLRREKCRGGYLWDRTTHAYIVKKKKCKDIIQLLLSRFNNQKIINPIDTVYVSLYKDISMYDYKPHLFYSTIAHKSDIQGVKIS